MDYRAEAQRIAREVGIDPDLFLRLIQQESGFRPDVVSPKGAIGLAQLMPGTASDLGVDPRDPIQNLYGGARYLKQQIDTFGNPSLGLAAYNAGPGNVRKHGGIPPFEETKNYVQSIMGGRVGSSAPMQNNNPTMPNRPSAGGLAGLVNFMRDRDEGTGLSRTEQFAAALDPLIMPEMRGGQAIRERGAQRVSKQRVNKTVEWLKNNGYGEAASIIEQNPSAASNVMSSILSSRLKSKEGFRPATPEEAAQYGAMAGQFDSSGRFYPTQKEDITRNLTEGQSKATGFFGRAEASNQVLSKLEGEGLRMQNYVAGKLPFGNFLRTAEGQQYDQAKRDFINSILRQESGAVIGESEFANAEQQYFPQPGDSAEVIAQKRRNREQAIAGLKVASGPGADIISQPATNGDGFSVTGKVE